jgi:hypothetical protein
MPTQTVRFTIPAGIQVAITNQTVVGKPKNVTITGMAWPAFVKLIVDAAQ